MSALSVRPMDSLHKTVKHVARRDIVSINQVATLAVAEKLSALEIEGCLGRRAGSASKTKFKRALKKEPNRKPEPPHQI